MPEHFNWKDRPRGGKPRPSLAFMMTALAMTWLALLVYDVIFVGDWQTSSSDYGMFRLLLPLLGLAPMLLRLLNPDVPTDDQAAYKTFVRLTTASLIIATLLALLQLVPYDYAPGGIPKDYWSFIVGRLVGLVTLVGIPLLAEWLVQIYHYRIRGASSTLARIYVYALAAFLVLGEFFPFDEFVTNGALAIGAFGFILSIRSGWLINLRKRQKLVLLGLSFIGFPASAAVLVVVQRDVSGYAIVSLMPALPALAVAICISLLFAHMIIFVSALLALPTADAIDRRNDEVSSLANFARLLTQSLETKDLIETSIALTCDATGATAAWIEVREGDRSEVHYGAAPKLPATVAEHLMSRNLQYGTSLSGAVRQSRRVEVLERISDAFWEDGGVRKELRSVAAVPLVLGEKLLGTLYAARERREGFDREEIVLLNALADQIAVALEHSRVIRTSMERQRFEQEMLIARDLQERLLPKVMPESPLYELYAESRPASIVGGDYYDVIAFSDCTIGVLIADVAGKGASAALYMGMVKGIVQAFSGRCNSPKELLAQANVALHGNIDQRWFATMTCAQIVEESRTLRISRAGHCPTLLVQGGEATFSRPQGLGLAIAGPALFDKNLSIEEVAFQPGDYAIFFSDGLPEARSADGQEYGYEALQSTVAAAAARGVDARSMRDAIIEAVEEFSQGEQQADDTTLVVLRWR